MDFNKALVSHHLDPSGRLDDHTRELAVKQYQIDPARLLSFKIAPVKHGIIGHLPKGSRVINPSNHTPMSEEKKLILPPKTIAHRSDKPMQFRNGVIWHHVNFETPEN